MDTTIEGESMKAIIFENKLMQPTILLSLHLWKHEGAGPNPVLQKRNSPVGLKTSGVFEENVGQCHSSQQHCKSKMVGVLSLIVFFLLQSTAIFAAQDDGDFARGNHFFSTGRYTQACDAYQKIENKGFAVLYNLGLSYLNQGKLSHAILYSKRAEKQASFKELTQLYEFFDCMHRQVDPDYVPGWYEQLAIFLKKCILSISMLLIQLILFIALILLIICWYKRWYPMNLKALICGVLFYILLISIWCYKTNMMQQRVGIVTKNLIYVFAGPDESFYKKAELHEADEVDIVNSQQGYYQVKAKQTIGWIHDNDIELV
jgi:tetratricopeptide (TPR) repeat protein